MSRHMHLFRFVVVMIGLGFVAPILWASNTGPSLEEAILALDQAIQNSASDDRVQKIQEAAAGFSFAMRREGIESSTGEFALGNAYFLANDLGRSIVHYRRGLSIDPTDEQLRENLEHARSFVEPTVPELESGLGWRQALLAWRGVLDRWTIWYCSVGLLSIASLMLTACVLSGNRFRIARGAVACGILGVIGVSLLWYEDTVGVDTEGVVVIMPGTGMYSGPGVGVYTEVYDGPLGIGTEGIVREFKGGWVRIELSNTQNGWVPADSIAFIHEGA